MNKPLGVLEPIGRRDRKTRFAVLGVPVSYTRWAWLAPFLHLAGMLPLAWWQARGEGTKRVALQALVLSQLPHVSNYLHSLGHILGGRAVGAPMDELIVTATRQVNVYEGDQSGYPTRTHLTRAAGGPLLNALVALVTLMLYRARGNGPQWLGVLALINVGVAAAAMLPLDTVDGGSILEHLGHEDKVIRLEG